MAKADKATLPIPTPRWAVPLLKPARYKGAHGGRASGKSHFFAELLVEEHIRHPHMQSVCIREIQRSLKFSAKKLIEGKIRDLGVSHLFDITMTEIRRKGGRGLIIFEGMQDHTADTIKSLEGFDRAWVEESQSLSARSVELLVPTIRSPGSEIWFSWNPDQPDDAVEVLLRDNPDAVTVKANYTDNPWCPDEMRQLADWQRKADYERYAHIWLGGYNTKSDAQVLKNWRVDEFDPDPDWDGPYFGLDWGFAQDPTAAVKVWVHDGALYIEHEAHKIGLELDHTVEFLQSKIPDIEKHAVLADSARPESISYMQRHGLPRIMPVHKWQGSVQDGIAHMLSYREIVVHTRCKEWARESRLYSHKVDRASGLVMPDIVDAHNHLMDATRYALQPLVKVKSAPRLRSL